MAGAVALVAMLPSGVRAQSGERLRFVTKLGRDTTVIEQFDRTATTVIGDLVYRSPRTRIVHYEVTTTPTHELVSALIATRAPSSAGGATVPSTVKITARGDSLVIERTRGDSTTQSSVAAHGRVIPWFSAQSVGLWELVVRAAAAKPGDSVEVRGLRLDESAKQIRVYVSRFRRDSVRVDYESFDIATHLGLDAKGHVKGLDGTPSTIKIRALPVATLDLAGLAEQFGREDAAGRSLGTFSPRDTARATVSDAAIQIDYGRPSRRGRDVWGTLLPPNEVWRLGANAATVIKTSHALQLAGDINLPAGSYSIWLIPGTSEGTFIVNSEVGQWGTQYKVAKDVVRFPVRAESLPAGTPEQFTARIESDAASRGRLLFDWDGRRYVVPFRVMP